MRSPSSHAFARQPRADIPRSTFDRSHRHLTTFDADVLVPILVDEVLPGDTFKCNLNLFARLATPEFPIMDNLYLETHAFFVPNRLLWDNWEKFCGAQDDPGDSIDFTVPVIGTWTNGPATGEISDYMGLPIGNTASNVWSALPFRANRLIWNEWFRDQNLQDSLDIDTSDSPNSDTYTNELLVRGKRHDYFTACLPWPQKGDAVNLPVGTGLVRTSESEGGILQVYSEGEGEARDLDTDGVLLNVGNDNQTGSVMYVDSISANINDLRLAVQTQRLLERDARSGSRYVEHVNAHFGVTVPDFRVQRPEFLGGGSSRINITPVAQTTQPGTPAAGDAKGALAGFGTVSGTHSWSKSFVEHGVVIMYASVRGDITYSQGVERYWNKATRFDFMHPVLANIGEQAVLNQEIYYQNSSADTDVFGYMPRYDEYRYKPSRVTGLFRPDAASNIDEWHLSEQFSSLPTLGSTFIESNTAEPLDRALAVPSEPQFIGDFYFDYICARPMPIHGVPGNLDRF